MADGADKSTVQHDHHDGTVTPTADTKPSEAAPGGFANEPEAAGVSEQHLAETGGDPSAPYLVIGGASALALGSAALFASVRRRDTTGGRRGR
jgi:chitin-binding protein